LAWLSSGTEAWQATIRGTATSSFDTARVVAVDAAGDVVAAGDIENTSHDFTVLKLDGASGVERWRQVINGSANSFDQALAVTVDAAGDVVAAGYITNSDTSADFTVLKLDGASGAERWRQVINGSANRLDQALAVTVDTAGDVVAAGTITNTGTGQDFTVLKLDGASGAERWRQIINGSANRLDQALAVTVDTAGDVVAAGTITNTGTGQDFTVLKLDGASGVERWRQVITGSANGDDSAMAVTVDAAGNVVAAGVTRNAGTSGDFTVLKLDGASGAEQWRQVINGTAPGGGDEAHAVAVDAAGDVVAAGRTVNSGTGANFTVLKLDGASGAERWRQVINGSATGDDFALAVAVDAAGDVVAAGYITNSGTLADFTVVKLDGASGAERWRQVINGSANDADSATAVTVDAAGNVVAAGAIRNSDTYQGMVVKLDGVSGAERWRQNITGTANSFAFKWVVAVDAAGDVVAAGTITNTGTERDFTVVKLDGASGAERWRQVINGSANDFDSAQAVAVDAAGNVVAAGAITNIGTELDFTVIKFSGASGAERWRQVINVIANSNDVAFAVAGDAAGDVVAAGRTESTSGFIVVKLRGTDGGDFEASACGGTGASRLRGRVRAAADPTGIPDVTLTLRGPGSCRETTTTNAQGHYVFRTLSPGAYTVTPAKDACTFTPADRTVTIAAHAGRARFRGTCP
jgi:hypothetical protein